MTCQHCQAAESNPLHAIYQSNCLDCSCRKLAQGPELWTALKAISNVPLQDAMQSLAGGDVEKYKQIREKVWFWNKRIKIERK